MSYARTALALSVAGLALLGAFVAIPGLGQALPIHAAAPSAADAVKSSPDALFVTSGWDDDGTLIFGEDFYSGPGADGSGELRTTVYFEVTGGTAGSQVTVNIQDENATRDGLTNPVWSATVTLGALGSYNNINEPAYTIPSNLPLGGQWTLNATSTTTATQTDQIHFNVHTWEVVGHFDNDYHLPGDSAKVFFQVLSYDSGGLVNTSIDLAATGCYEVTVLNACTPLTGLVVPASGDLGNITLSIPTNARIGSTLTLYIWANSSTASTRYSEQTVDNPTIIIVGVQNPDLCVGTDSTGSTTCGGNPTFTQGTQLVLRVTSIIGTSPGNDEGFLPNVPVSVNWSEGGLAIPTPGGFPSSFTTDGTGVALGLFGTSGISPGVVTVGVFITDPLDNQLHGQQNLTFTIVPSSSSIVLQVTLGQGQYFGGDSLTGNFAILSTSTQGGSAPAPVGWKATYYTIYAYPGVTGVSTCSLGALSNNFDFLLQGPLTGASGSIPAYSVPTDLTGLLVVTVYASNSTQTATSITATSGCATVSPPTLLVNPSEVNYVAGDTISVSLTTEGSIFTNDAPVTFYATVSDVSSACPGSAGDGSIFSKQVNSSFSFTIPSAGTLPEYTLTVVAQDHEGELAAQDVCLTEIAGFQLSVSIGTPSQYSDDSYQPGQTISLNYQITALGTATLPQSVVLSILDLSSNTPEQRADESSPSGSFSYTIPKSSGTGFVLLEVEASLVSPTSGSGTTSVYTYSGVNVESSPSALDYEIGAGSGFTVGLLIVILLIVALVIVGLVYLRRRRMMGPGGPSHFQEFHGHQPEPMHEAMAAAPTDAGTTSQEPMPYDPGGVHPGDPSLGGGSGEPTYVPPPGVNPESDPSGLPPLPPPPPPPT